ncbi:MAG: TM2 domain-containing protein [Defluviitaleaceae bacterium]|nr:TM2 domain-containing protein [Defluviitaleaceae bacterium]
MQIPQAPINPTRNERVDMWIMANHKYFPPERVQYLQERMQHLPETHFNYLYALKMHDPTTILLLSIFLGGLGIDRFVLGDVGLGVGKLCVWLFGWILWIVFMGWTAWIWWIVDIFLVSGRAREKNFETVINFLTYYGY